MVHSIDFHIHAERVRNARPNMGLLAEYRKREVEFLDRAKDLDEISAARDAAKTRFDQLRKSRLEEFMTGFNTISSKLKEMYQVRFANCFLKSVLRNFQMITLGGNAELELVDSLDPFSEGIIFSVMPPKKSWKNISNLSGGEKVRNTLTHRCSVNLYVHLADIELSCSCVRATCLQGESNRSSL